MANFMRDDACNV